MSAANGTHALSAGRADGPARRADLSADLSAERHVLGAMLRDNEVVDSAIQAGLRRDDFATDAHQRLFAAMAELHDAGRPFDVGLLADHLRDRQQLEALGPRAYAILGELLEAAPTAANATHYVSVVRAASLRRRLLSAVCQIADDVQARAGSAEELLASAERTILALAEMGTEGQTVPLGAAAGEYLDQLDARSQARQAGTLVDGVPSGLIDLDDLTGGLKTGESIVVAARTSVGKTAFALHVAARAAIDLGLPTLYVSLEMGRAELAGRLLCTRASVDSRRCREGRVSADEAARLGEADAILRQAPLHIDDAPGQTMLRIAASARRLNRKHGLRLLVIDYLQLVDPDNRRDPRQEQVARLSRRAKHLARELQVPVILLAQVNRSPETRTNKRPLLSDLRESGAIEQDADVVILLHRADDKPGRIEAIVAKQRNGPTGSATLSYDAMFTRFGNYAEGFPP